MGKSTITIGNTYTADTLLKYIFIDELLRYDDGAYRRYKFEGYLGSPHKNPVTGLDCKTMWNVVNREGDVIGSIDMTTNVFIIPTHFGIVVLRLLDKGDTNE